MIQDDVIREVRAAREEYARMHGYSVRAMVADLRAKDLAGGWPVVNRAARRSGSSVPSQPLQPTGAATSVSQE